jgi:hypothetical protein
MTLEKEQVWIEEMLRNFLKKEIEVAYNITKKLVLRSFIAGTILGFSLGWLLT